MQVTALHGGWIPEPGTGAENSLGTGRCAPPSTLASYAMLRRGALTVISGEHPSTSPTVIVTGSHRTTKEDLAVASSPQLPLADDLFLTAHDTVKGKCLLTPATLGLGL